MRGKQFPSAFCINMLTTETKKKEETKWRVVSRIATLFTCPMRSCFFEFPYRIFMPVWFLSASIEHWMRSSYFFVGHAKVAHFSCDGETTRQTVPATRWQNIETILSLTVNQMRHIHCGRNLLTILRTFFDVFLGNSLSRWNDKVKASPKLFPFLCRIATESTRNKTLKKKSKSVYEEMTARTN